MICTPPISKPEWFLFFLNNTFIIYPQDTVTIFEYFIHLYFAFQKTAQSLSELLLVFHWNGCITLKTFSSGIKTRVYTPVFEI